MLKKRIKMKRLNRFHLVLITLFMLVGCAASNQLVTQSNTGGIGGTGVIPSAPSKTGIGGTGQVADRGIGGTGKSLENGIGGTGQQAQLDEESANTNGSGGIGGTGIVGTITGFGSIWVNDTRVIYDINTPITINQQPASAGDFLIGQVVAVVSQRANEAVVDTESWHSPQEVFFGDEPDTEQTSEFKAKSIDIVHEVVGPVSKLLSGKGQLEILNQPVFVNEQTAIVDSRTGKPIAFADLSLGDHIEVSGLRQADGEIIASRLDIVSESVNVELIGELIQQSNGQWFVNNQAIVVDELLIDQQLDQEQSRTLITGVLNGETLHVESLGQDSIAQLFEQVDELLYEGYVFEDELEGVINVGGHEFALPDLIELSEEWDDGPVRINAHHEDGEYEAHDFFIEEGDEYEDLLPEDDWDHEDYEEYYDEVDEEFSEEFDDENAFEHEDFEEDFYEEEFEEDFYEEEFEEDFYEEFDDEFYDEEFEEDFYDEDYEE
jgi:hypothetical protein